MRCLSPRTVGFLADGKTLTWSKKKYSKEFATFPFPCGKCLECRAEQGATKAIRCAHEAQMHDESCFVTLTYDDRFVTKKLEKTHVQKFVKKLRARYGDGIRVVWTGEYGDLEKRPHWHLLIFGWSPRDPQYLYTTDRGDKSYWSQYLGPKDRDMMDDLCKNPKQKQFKKMLWKYGKAEFGSLTLHSASYVCRYALKKLVHGKDQDHEFHPIHNFRNKIGIGRKWIEQYWPDLFNHGRCLLPDGSSMAIPRYYQVWLAKNQPDAWMRYVTQVKAERDSRLGSKAEKQKEETDKINWSRLNNQKGLQISDVQVRNILSKNKFARLQARLKGDI